LGDTKNVTVNILCEPEGKLDNVLLKEEASPSFIVINNNSPRYMTLNDPINESITDADQTNWKTFERKNQKSICAKINTVYPGSWIKYTYSLKLNNTGWNYIYTIIKYYDIKKKSHLPDYVYSTDCVFVEKEIPSLFITVTKNKKVISPNEDLTLEYEIKYLGESQEYLPIEVGLDENNMNIYKSNSSILEPLFLSKEHPARFSRTINFSISNDYTAPKLIINGLPYEINSGDCEIAVQTWDKRNSEYIYWLLQILGLVAAFALGFREFKNLEATISRVGKEIKIIRQLVEKYINNKGDLDENRNNKS
jgi:hypothetical protein